MSQKPISLSPDLKRLRDEGYNIEIRAAYLLLKDVPYVTPNKEVKCGVIVSKLTLAGVVTGGPTIIKCSSSASTRAIVTERR